MVGVKKIGVLALQGAFAKHIAMLERLGVQGVEVRKPSDLFECAGLIIPGGESTTILRNILFIKLREEILNFSKSKPLFGTCAGLILMSKKIVADPFEPFGILDIEVERNAYGRQAESFISNVDVEIDPKHKKSVPAVFIRAPRISKVNAGVDILARLEGDPILVKQGMHLGATFHPELTDDPYIHEYFVQSVS